MQKNSFTFIVIICPITNLLPQFFCVLKYIFVKYTNSPFSVCPAISLELARQGLSQAFCGWGGRFDFFFLRFEFFNAEISNFFKPNSDLNFVKAEISPGLLATTLALSSFAGWLQTSLSSHITGASVLIIIS